MLDLSNIPSQQQTTTIFYATGNWQTWNKPRNAKFIEIFCLGGGASGGQNVLSNPTGGGGGGSGGIVRGLIPAFLLPDTLYILVGKGGAGVTTAASGNVGGISYIGLQPSTSEQTLICKSSTSPPGGGSQASTAGAGAPISVVSLSAFGNLGFFTAIAGVAGGAGGVSGGGGSNVAALASNLLTGGAGAAGRGASVFNTGGSVTAASSILTTQVNGGQSSGSDGESGYGFLQPFCGTGGGGGASNLSGPGGRGGNGWYGCGGGGAGGSTNTLSSSGAGGDGLVIITVIC
jgi:hypothetical protein